MHSVCRAFVCRRAGVLEAAALDLRRRRSGHPAKQHAAAVRVGAQGLSADLRGQPTGHLAHRGEQRQATAGIADGLIRDGGNAALEHPFGARPGRGQMRVSEHDLPTLHAVELGRNRLLDLEDQLAPAPHLVGRVDDLRADRGVLGVREGRSGSGTGLANDVVARPR